MISSVKGEFQSFDAKIISRGEDFEGSRITAIVDAASIYTNNEERDTHLRSGDFFESRYHKHLKFKGTGTEKLNDTNYKLKGLLTIRGNTREVVLEVELGGFMTDPDGQEKAGFSIKGKINRKDFGLTWNKDLGKGGVLVSDEVRIEGDLQFIKQP